MADIITVKLWGIEVGRLGYGENNTEFAIFQYNSKYVDENYPSISPLKLPVNKGAIEFDAISYGTFHGLPGVFADSLPDKFGNSLIDIFMNEKGYKREEITALDRLMYIGDRSMGALEYEPSNLSEELKSLGVALDIKLLSELCEKLLTNKSNLAKELHDAKTKEAVLNLIRIGSSAGGARSKALVAQDEEGKLYDGTIDQGKGFKYYLLKFDTDENSDREKKDPKGMTRIEYIYSHHFAKEVGIDIPDVKYIEEEDDFHFMIERFDRVYTKNKLQKLHYISWAGLEHYHRDGTGVYAYEQLATTIKEMNLGQNALTELFKRTVFNIVGKNQDDHTKNFGFLMNRDGIWSLAPAFDLTFMYDETGKWTKVHQILLNRKQDNFTREDLIAFSKKCNIKPKLANEIIDKTVLVFKSFEARAKEYNVPIKLAQTVSKNLRRYF
jgi:serine/threonine-protein kinase HipA